MTHKNKFADWQFYHIYPMGFCNAPEFNDFFSEPQMRLDLIREWVPHLKKIGVNALYLGPIFEATSHGYDTKDYYWVDRRLGTNQSMKELVEFLHHNGISVILDGVFNHAGRDFWAFKDLQDKLQESDYKDWFTGIDFNGNSPYGDRFSYHGWNGHYNLVKLNLHNPNVKHHLFNAISMWINELGIDGIRLDACDQLNFDFISELSSFVKSIKPDFWLMGEIIHGDYRLWANPSKLDSVTNYECFKGLWSSFNDINFFEIAYAFNRQFGVNGLYKDLHLYNFADNHDVNRVASSLNDPVHLFPLYILLYTMPGIPSLYYGSEWGISGKKGNNLGRKNDNSLRPYIELNYYESNSSNFPLKDTISRLASIRHKSDALRYGDYQQIYLNHQQFAYSRHYGDKNILIMVNSDNIKIQIPLKFHVDGYDLLNRENFCSDQKDSIEIYPNWGRIIEYTKC